MTYNKLQNTAAVLITATMLLGALPVFAQTTATPATKVVGANAAARLSAVITKANADIAARITALNALSTRVQDLKNASAEEKANIASEVQTNVAGLNALQTTIDADTDATKARADAQTIFTTFRIYALVVPRGWILASADRVLTVSNLMTTLGTKIQARITADEAAGKNVTSLVATLADMNAKIADANSQATASQTGVTALLPDQGNKTVAASNKSALVASHTNIKTATQDLKTARADIKTLLTGLKALGTPSTTSTSTPTQ